MKKLILVILIFCGFSCSHSTRNPMKTDLNKLSLKEKNLSKFVISNGKLGSITIGENFDSVLTKLDKEYVVSNDSTPACEGCDEYTPLYSVHNSESNNSLFVVEPGWEDQNKDKLFRIMVYSDEFETDKGITVGMTFKNLKERYEVIELDKGGETGLHIFVKDFNGSFGIEMPNDDNWWSLTKETLPENLKIIEIIIV